MRGFKHKYYSTDQSDQKGSVSTSRTFDYLAVKLGKVGFVARGFVWSSVGGVSIAASFGLGATEGTKGALEIVAANTGGRFVIVLATIGIFAYSLWRLFECAYGLSYNGEDSKLKAVLNGYIIPFMSAVGYLGFGISNCETLATGKDDSATAKSWEARVTSYTIGKIFFTVVGVTLAAVAVSWLVQLAKKQYKGNLDDEKVRQDEEKLGHCCSFTHRKVVTRIIYALAITGITGRAWLFLLLSTLVLREAWVPSTPEGSFGEALGQLQTSHIGKVCLAVTGFLVILFGLYSITLARYKKFLFYHPECSMPRTSTSGLLGNQ